MMKVTSLGLKICLCFVFLKLFDWRFFLRIAYDLILKLMKTFFFKLEKKIKKTKQKNCLTQLPLGGRNLKVQKIVL